MKNVTLKKVQTSEVNVSERHTSYDVYIGGEYVKTFNDVIDALDFMEMVDGDNVEVQ